MGRDNKPNPYARADQFSQRARAEGFPARSVYKLEEIDRRIRVFRAGQRVLDLGCAPGSWLMYAAKKTAPSGRVRGIDLKGLEVALPPNALAIAGDALDPSPEAHAFLLEGAPYDVVMSDMAPSTSGTAFADQARSAELVERTLDVAEQWLNKGGVWIAKLFMSEAIVELRKRVRLMFAEERIIRPEGTRSVSTEVFLVGIGKRAEPTAVRPAPSEAAPISPPTSVVAPPKAAPARPSSAKKAAPAAAAPRRARRTPKG